MIKKVEMYTVECDNCKKTRGEDSDFSCWGDENYALEEAKEGGWIEENEFHYCEHCVSYNDQDELIIDASRKDKYKD